LANPRSVSNPDHRLNNSSPDCSTANYLDGFDFIRNGGRDGMVVSGWVIAENIAIKPAGLYFSPHAMNACRQGELIYTH
jgi:hypothetical protein